MKTIAKTAGDLALTQPRNMLGFTPYSAIVVSTLAARGELCTSFLVSEDTISTIVESCHSQVAEGVAEHVALTVYEGIPYLNDADCETLRAALAPLILWDLAVFGDTVTNLVDGSISTFSSAHLPPSRDEVMAEWLESGTHPLPQSVTAQGAADALERLCRGAATPSDCAYIAASLQIGDIRDMVYGTLLVARVRLPILPAPAAYALNSCPTWALLDALRSVSRIVSEADGRYVRELTAVLAFCHGNLALARVCIGALEAQRQLGEYGSFIRSAIYRGLTPRAVGFIPRG